MVMKAPQVLISRSSSQKWAGERPLFRSLRSLRKAKAAAAAVLFLSSSTKRKVLLFARMASKTDLYCVETTDKTWRREGKEQKADRREMTEGRGPRWRSG